MYVVYLCICPKKTTTTSDVLRCSWTTPDGTNKIDPWRYSTPSFGAYDFCITNIDNFRRQPENKNDLKNEEVFEYLGYLKYEDKPRNENKK